MAARPTFGQLPEFQADLESIKAYVEQANIFFLANDIQEDKQPIVLLSTIGGEMYALLRNLLAPDQPQDKSLAEIITAL